MPVGGYPITNIRSRVHDLVDYGYRVWSWQLEGPAYECPMEPLRQEFWEEQEQEERLASGVLLPSLDEQAPGDLLILVTQSLIGPFDGGFSHLKVDQLWALQRVLLKLDFPQISLLRSIRSRFDRHLLLKELESSFISWVLPRMAEEGIHYRRLQKLEISDPTQTDSLGVGHCTRCQQKITYGNGIHVLKAYRMDPETVFILGTCNQCQKVIATAINPYFTNIW